MVDSVIHYRKIYSSVPSSTGSNLLHRITGQKSDHLRIGLQLAIHSEYAL